MQGGSSLQANAAECPICMELYESEGAHMPYVFNCAHTLCHARANSIKTTDSKTGAASWRYPSCQAVTTHEPKPNVLLYPFIEDLEGEDDKLHAPTPALELFMQTLPFVEIKPQEPGGG